MTGPRPRRRDRCTAVFQDVDFAPWVRRLLTQPAAPTLTDRDRCEGSPCPCEWCRPPTPDGGLHQDDPEGGGGK